jgi:hypothetical protein
MIILILLSWSQLIIDGQVIPLAIASTNEETSTSLTAWFRQPHYLNGEEIVLDVSTWDSNKQLVVTGEIHVVDLNSSIMVQETVLGAVTVLSWQDSYEHAGIHLIEVSYIDPTGYYSSSSLQLKILIGDIITTGDTGMNIQLDKSNYFLTTNQLLSLNVTLESQDIDFPYFYIDENSAYISIEAIMGNIRHVLSLDYPSKGIITSLDFSLPLILPPWIEPGPLDVVCVFSGSIISDLDRSEFSFTLSILPGEKSLVMETSTTTIERSNLTEKHSLVLDIQVPGYAGEQLVFDLILLTLVGEHVETMLDNVIIDSYYSEIPVVFYQDIPVGSYNLSGSLLDWNTGLILASDNIVIDVIDDLFVDNFYWNLSSENVIPGQIIEGYLISREEDTFQARQAYLEIRDNTTNTPLFNITTTESGYVFFTFDIPDDFQAGIHQIDFELSPLLESLYYTSSVRSFEVSMRKLVTIQHREDQTLIRGNHYLFNATIVDSDDLPVIDGSISLVYGDQILHTATGVQTTSYLFQVPTSFQRGINTLKWYYSGSTTHNSAEVYFPVTVFSVPQFSNVILEDDELFAGDNSILSGTLVDENNYPIIQATVILNHVDNWGNETTMQKITNDDGRFAFDIDFDTDSAGIHSFTVDFIGWNEEFYLTMLGKYYLEVSVNPQVSLSYSGEIISGEDKTLLLTGKPSEVIKTEFYDNDSWQHLEELILDEKGACSFTWGVPDYLRGPILVRVGYVNGSVFSYFSLSIKTRPVVIVEIPEEPATLGEEISIFVTSSEKFSLLIDGEIWQQDVPAGSYQYSPIITDSGDHEIKVIVSDEYSVETIVTKTISIRQDYLVDISFPTRVQKGVNLNVVIHIETIDSQPIEGFTVRLYANETIVASSKTSQEGSTILNSSLNKGIFKIKVEIIPPYSRVYHIKNISLDNDLTVYELPEIEIRDVIPIKGQSVKVEVIVSSYGEPVIGELIDLYLQGFMLQWLLIGTGITNDQGIATAWWNVTQDTGEYFLQAKNLGEPLLESVIITKAVQILDEEPKILMASISLINNDNIYQVITVVDFPNGEGNVYLYSQNGTVLGTFKQDEGNFWNLQLNFEPGYYQLLIKAVDSKNVESWKEMNPLLVPSVEQVDPIHKQDNRDFNAIITETLISTILLVPIASYFIYKRKKTLLKFKSG